MSVVAPHDADAPGTLVARGATAVVYRVDDQLGGHVAWKISRGGAAINEAFVCEVDMMKLVGSHPHIVALHHFDFAHNLPTLVQEYAAGGDLLSGLCNSADLKKPIPTMVVKKIAVQLLLAVQQVHRAGVLHRDIKLENLLLRFPCPDGRLDLVRDGHVHLLLADFGFACREANTGHIKCSGTFCTMSPECLQAWQVQRRGGVIAKRYSFQSDVWSVGVVLVEILTQKRPFVGKDDYETRARVEDFGLSQDYRDRVLRCVPLEARDLVTNLLCPDPAKRITVEKALNHPWLQGALLNLAEHVHVEDLRHWSQATTTALVDQQPETTSPDTFHLLPPSESVVEQSPAVQRVEKHKKLATPDHVSALDAIADTLKELDA